MASRGLLRDTDPLGPTDCRGCRPRPADLLEQGLHGDSVLPTAIFSRFHGSGPEDRGGLRRRAGVARVWVFSGGCQQHTWVR
jgi:hypothetical protein